jgi:D-3-phosphoglycerate dehydrogenase
MTATVLITGPALAPAAMAMASERGLRVISSPPYLSDADLTQLIAKEQPDAIIVRMSGITASMIDTAPRLKIIAKHGVGVDDIDLAAAAAKGIPVAAAIGANAQSVAELGLALMLSVARATAWLDRRVREGHWDKATHVGSELSGKSLGVVGVGAIGRILISLVEPFRMTIRAYDPYLAGDLGLPGVQRVNSLDALLEASDIVSLHCPLTEETRHLIGAAQLARMRPAAILVNAARGELVDTDALVAALREGRIAGAGLDTFAPEPPPADSPLWSLPNLVATPHIGANTHEARVRMGTQVMQQVLDCLDGRPLDPRVVVNRRLLAEREDYRK